MKMEGIREINNKKEKGNKEQRKRKGKAER